MRLPRIINAILCVILSASIAGCATMFNGSSQVISIRSNIDDAKLYVDETYIGKGNGVATFQKKKDYTIRARKEGCRDGIIIPTKSFDPTTLLGILIDWGIISILIIDGAATGAWQKFDQTGYTIDPDCSGGNTESVNSVQGNAQKEDKKETPAVEAKSAQPTTNFNGGSIDKK